MNQRDPVVAIISYRLFCLDGVSYEAAKWGEAFESLGFQVRFIAGNSSEGVDTVSGLSLRGSSWTPVDSARLNRFLEDVDLVVVENLFSTSWNPRATREVAKAIAGRPAIIKHHDVAWDRPGQDQSWVVPTDPNWLHVSINGMNALKLASRGIGAEVVHNAFHEPDKTTIPLEREVARAWLGLDSDDFLILQPTRINDRKNVQGGLQAAGEIAALMPKRRVVYWITGEADGLCSPDVFTAIDQSPVEVKIGAFDKTSPVSAYAASDMVMFPSFEEGFGNPVIESALFRKPLMANRYPVLDEILAHGFEVFFLDEAKPLNYWLQSGDRSLTDRNAARANEFSMSKLSPKLSRLAFRVFANARQQLRTGLTQESRNG